MLFYCIAYWFFFQCLGLSPLAQAYSFRSDAGATLNATQIDHMQEPNRLHDVLSSIGKYTAEETMAMLHVVCHQQLLYACKQLGKNERKRMTPELKACYLQGENFCTKKAIAVTGVNHSYDANIQFFCNFILNKQPLCVSDIYQMMNAFLHFERPSYTPNQQIKIVITDGLDALKQRRDIDKAELFYGVLHLTNSLYISFNKDYLNHRERESPCRWPLMNELTLWFAEHPKQLISELLKETLVLITETTEPGADDAIKNNKPLADVNRQALFTYIQNKLLTPEACIALENKQILEHILNNQCNRTLIALVNTVQNLYDFYGEMKVPLEPMQQEKSDTATDLSGRWQKIKKITHSLFKGTAHSDTEKYNGMIAWLQQMKNHEATLEWCETMPAATIVILALYDIAQDHSKKENLSIKDALTLLVQQRFETPLKDKAVNGLLCKTRQTDGHYYSYSRKNIKVARNCSPSDTPPESCLTHEAMQHSKECALTSRPPCLEFGGCDQHKRRFWLLMPATDYLRKTVSHADVQFPNSPNGEHLRPHKDCAEFLEADDMMLPEDKDDAIADNEDEETDEQGKNQQASAANHTSGWNFIKTGLTIGCALMVLASGLSAYETDMARLASLTRNHKTGNLSELTAKCPHIKHRRIIEEHFGCGVYPPGGYICVTDENSRLYRQMCHKLINDPEGYYLAYTGDFDRRSCNSGTYQPTTFSYKVYDGPECRYKTHQCNEEGQIVHSAATPVTNTLCICDSANGFARLSNATHLPFDPDPNRVNLPGEEYFDEVPDVTCIQDKSKNPPCAAPQNRKGGLVRYFDEQDRKNGTKGKKFVRGCGCDDTKGYFFNSRSQFKNQFDDPDSTNCFTCDPSKEDCSCVSQIEDPSRKVCKGTSCKHNYGCSKGFKACVCDKWIAPKLPDACTEHKSEPFVDSYKAIKVYRYGRWKLLGGVVGCIGCALACGGYAVLDPSCTVTTSCTGDTDETRDDFILQELHKHNLKFSNDALTLENFQPIKMDLCAQVLNSSISLKIKGPVSNDVIGSKYAAFIKENGKNGKPIATLRVPGLTSEMLGRINGKLINADGQSLEFDTAKKNET